MPLYLIYIHTYLHTYLHTYIHTYIHAYIHTYIHMYTCLGAACNNVGIGGMHFADAVGTVREHILQ